MKKKINKSQVKVEVKNHPNDRSESIIIERYEAIAFFDDETLFKVSNDRFILERKIQEFRDRDGQWKYWENFGDLNRAGIRKIPIRKVPNSRMRVRSERYEMTRQDACQWFLYCFIPHEFHADFQITATPSGMPASASIAAENKNTPDGSYDPNKAGLITLRTIYDEFICEKKFEDGVYELNGIQELIQHHPGFKNETLAMQKIFEGEQVLNDMRARTANL